MCKSNQQREARTERLADLRAFFQCIEDHKLESEYLPKKLENLHNLIASIEQENASRSLTSPNANPALCTAPETPSQQHISIKRSQALIVTEIAGDASLGATTTVSSMKILSKHLKQSIQGKHS